MSASPVVTFRWNFKESTLATRSYAEAELHNSGRPGAPSHFLMIYLVRDEMRLPQIGEMLDADRRDGVRVFVGSFHDENECRLLAHLSAEEAARRAYTRIYETCMAHFDKVQSFGDDWLTATISDAIDRDGARV
jgi:hypothetical protein